MSNSVPIYVSYIKSDELGHIVVGKELDTLCENNKIIDAVQVASNENPTKILNTQYCEKCVEKWNEIQYDIVREPTIHCFICRNSVSGHLARYVEHMNKGNTEVCKVCYNKLYNNESSNVNIPYEKAEPAFPKNGDRIYKD